MGCLLVKKHICVLEPFVYMSTCNVIQFSFGLQSACNLRIAGIEATAELLERQLAAELSKLTLEEALSLARTLSHQLNLMGIAETHHRYTVL